MKAYQVILTNEKKGHLSSKNFSIAALSEGIEDSDKKEIENRFSLDNLKINTDAYGFELPVPVYSFSKLKSGRYLFSRMIREKEDKERFICHAIILDDELQYYPVELFGSPIFIDSYGDNKNSKEKTNLIGEQDFVYKASLPVLDELQVGEVITFDSVSKFIKEARVDTIKEMISVTVSFSSNHYPVFILDSFDNILLWIASVQMSFPVKLAHLISFTTTDFYSKDVDYILNGSNTVNSYEPLGERCYIFDYKHGFKRRPVLNLSFTRIVELGYLVSKETLNSFQNFIIQFDIKEINEEIENCYKLFIISRFDINSVDKADIKPAFEYALNHGSQDILESIFEVIEPYMDDIIRMIDQDSIKPLSQYLFKTAVNSSRVILFERACLYFYSLIDHLVFDYSDINLEEVYMHYKEIINFCKDRSHYLLKHSISIERISYLITLLSKDNKPGFAQFYLEMIVDNLYALGYYWSQSLLIDNMGVFIDLCINLICDANVFSTRVIEASAKSDEFFPRLVILFYNRIGQNTALSEFLRAFISAIDLMDEEKGLETRRKISSLKCSKILLEEYRVRLDFSENKVDFYNSYCSNVIFKIPDFSREYFSGIVKLYIQNLDGKDLYEESIKLIRQIIGQEAVLDDDAISMAIKGFESGFHLSSPDNEIREIIVKVKKIKKVRNIITSPDITQLANFAIWLEDNKGQYLSIKDALEWEIDVNMLHEKKYQMYIKWSLPLLIAISNTPEDHKAVVHYLNTKDKDIVFFTVYINALECILNQDRSTGMNKTLQFMVYFFYYLEPRYKVLEEFDLLSQMITMFTVVFLKQQSNFIKTFDKELRKEFENRKLSFPVQWDKIYSEVISKNNTSLMKSIVKCRGTVL